MLKIGGNASTIVQLHTRTTDRTTYGFAKDLKMWPICFVMSFLTIYSVNSEECAASVRPQSDVVDNWNQTVPEEWSGLSDCKLKVYENYG